MKLHGFIKNASDIYFSKKTKGWKNSKRYWSFFFIAFFSLYLFQIYSAYIELSLITDSTWINPDEIWQIKIDAIKIQGIVLTGIFIRFLASMFRGNWAIRFGDVGEFIAFSAICRHVFWTSETISQSNSAACTSTYLIGMNSTSNWIGMFLYGWILYKILWVIAVIWKTVRQ